MKTVYVPVMIVVCIAVTFAARPVLGIEGLSRGHNLLLMHGLQIQGSCLTPSTDLDLTTWARSNFTTANFWNLDPLLQFNHLSPEVPLGIAGGNGDSSYGRPVISSQYKDEEDLTDPIVLARTASQLAVIRNKYPNALSYTNQGGDGMTSTELQTYMTAATPDMLMFDIYPFWGEPYYRGGYRDVTEYYGYMEKYRELGLAGNDGTGTTPIPTGIWTQTKAGSYMDYHVVSESEIRLNNFSAWSFGNKFVSAWLYQNETSVLFTDGGSTNTTDQFDQVAETNRQSLNLAPSLVRLISTDVRMEMGRHEEEFLGIPYTVTNTLPDGVQEWSTTADLYIESVSATNLGSENNGLRGDAIVGYFKPLDASFTNAGHADDTYFMIVNGLSSSTGSAADCQQSVHITFDFGDSGITNLLRRNRDTGLIETVDLVQIAGSQYSLDLILDGGTGDLFKFNDGGMFVPEPNSLCMLGIGLAISLGTLVFRRWRNQA